MANRFPLIVNPDTKEIQELKLNDNLDLTGNGIYAGGSIGNNGQVLTSNGTTVEWRTVTGGGGGGGGLDLNTTYIIETEEQADGANLNLVAGGTGVGTIRVKFLDNAQLKFDSPNNLTIAPSIKPASITNSLLANSSFSVTVDGVTQSVSLGGSFAIPIYGDVYRTAAQTITNKTFSNCLLSGAINTFSSIPNSALLNNSITINNTVVPLGGSINIAGGGGGGVDTNTTYSLSAIDWSENGVNNPNKKAIRLTGSDAATTNAVLVAGSRISLSRNGNEITITGTEINTDTDTTYSVNTDSLIVNNSSVGARLNLVGGGTGSGNGTTDRINFRSGTGVTISSSTADDISVSIGQNVATTANVTFNDLTLTGNLNVSGALTYVNTTNLVVTDKTITIADGVTNSVLANGSGILLGTSNINLTYSHDAQSWESTSNLNLVPTKVYKIGNTTVLSSTQVLGKSMPTGNIVGTIDTQTLSNKTLVNPVISSVINTGTVYFPAPNIADTLVGRNTSDILTNKVINGNNNTISNIGNSSLANSSIVINGNTVALGGSITVVAQDPYSDEKAQDAVAGSFTNGVHSGINFTYDDTTGRINANVTNTFVYPNISDFPSALTNEGGIAYSENDGALYYSNGVSWTSQRVVTTNSSTSSDLATLLNNFQLTYSLSAVDQDSERKKIRLSDSQGVTSELVVRAHNGLNISRSNNEISLTGTTYGISAENATGTNANLRLTQTTSAGTTNDDVLLVGTNGLTITRTDANTLTFSIPSTASETYTNEEAQDAAAQLFSNGTHTGITFTYNDVSNSINATVTGGGGAGGGTLYDLVGSNTTSNNAIITLSGADNTEDSIEFVGGGGTSVTWDDLNNRITLSSTAPVQADWNATSGLAQILNKPTIPPAYTLPTASATVLGGIKVGANLTINPVTGVLDANPGSYTLPIASPTTLGGIKIGAGMSIDANGVVSVSAADAPIIQDLSGTSSLLNINSTGEINIVGYNAYSLFKITTDAEAWVRVYVDDASRDADSTRSEGVDPAPGSGIIAEVRTSGAESILISPGVMGFNNDSPRTSTIYVSATNRSSSPTTITVTLTAVQIGA